MSQLGTAQLAIDNTILNVPIYEPVDVDYPVIRMGMDSSVGVLPFYPLTENPAHEDFRIYHPTYGVMALHDASSVRTLYESFEDNSLSEYDVTEYWSIRNTSNSTHGDYALAWDGEYNGSNTTIRSFSGLGYYPERGDTFGYDAMWRWQTNARHGFMFGVQTHGGDRPMYPTAYYLRFDGSQGDVKLEYDTYGGVLETVCSQSVDYTGLADEAITVEIDWGDPTISVTASTSARGQFVDMHGDHTALDAGGIGMGGVKNTYDTTDTRLLWDSLYYQQ